MHVQIQRETIERREEGGKKVYAVQLAKDEVFLKSIAKAQEEAAKRCIPRTKFVILNNFDHLYPNLTQSLLKFEEKLLQNCQKLKISFIFAFRMIALMLEIL